MIRKYKSNDAYLTWHSCLCNCHTIHQILSAHIVLEFLATGFTTASHQSNPPEACKCSTTPTFGFTSTNSNSYVHPLPLLIPGSHTGNMYILPVIWNCQNHAQNVHVTRDDFNIGEMNMRIGFVDVNPESCANAKNNILYQGDYPRRSTAVQYTPPHLSWPNRKPRTTHKDQP